MAAYEPADDAPFDHNKMADVVVPLSVAVSPLNDQYAGAAGAAGAAGVADAEVAVYEEEMET